MIKPPFLLSALKSAFIFEREWVSERQEERVSECGQRKRERESE